MHAGCRWWGSILVVIALLPVMASAQATPDWDAAGLRDAGTYRSPQYGFAVTWDALWAPSAALGEHAIVSDAQAGDYVSLTMADPGVRAEIYGNTWLAWGYANERDPLVAMVDAFATAPAGIDGGTFAVLHREMDGNHAALAIVTDTYADGTLVLVYREFWNIDGRAFIFDSLSAPPKEFAAAWEAAGSIALDGDLAFAALTDAEVDDIVDSAELALTGRFPR